ncbi:multisubunit Na+/H+ antiporter MnhC subunit [Halopolyspora algeriensis]|uniref:Multisubunit Na+/H+ antiporter MnhC subunit n=1 Tax=Halopolyspora algeriensis TaxID=1500506 RepID=A0A368VCW7_9ACTN|nr:NADH-quinone oxidoreductase subunit K [Halopolyspora algeriensis]RCW39127.1 multisubunit Na+/H+ antiporter MnhC subunit [Halopolyspora algeriensis]TQM56575.1 multisubunit Na+/H+ antiporter MnhC subunit [Halopolyspora algeriensis]
MSDAIATGMLAAAGIYLLMQRGFVRAVIGFLLLQHAVNLLLITARAPQRDEAPIVPLNTPSDPLGQAFVLTAIVIGLGSVLFLLAVALRYSRLRNAAVVEQHPPDSAARSSRDPGATGADGRDDRADGGTQGGDELP